MELILELLQDFGYYLLFVVLLLENMIVLGLIVPGETVLFMADALAGRSLLNIELVIGVAASAALIGQNAGYFIGRKGGRPLLTKLGSRFMGQERIEAAELYFKQHGGKTVFIGRFAAGIRVFIPLLAGAFHMNYGRFFIYTFGAVVSWTVLIGVLGFVFGENWELITGALNGVGWAVVLALLVGLVAFWLRRRRHGSQA